MKNILIGLIFGFVIGLFCNLPLCFCDMNEEIEVYQIEVDSLEGIIEASVDTIQYESIDTTVIRWPWGREEFYYFKYKES